MSDPPRVDRHRRRLGDDVLDAQLPQVPHMEPDDVDGKVREIETKSYGFVQGHVKWTKGKDTRWMDATLVAVPASGGTFVGVHYANLR